MPQKSIFQLPECFLRPIKAQKFDLPRRNKGLRRRRKPWRWTDAGWDLDRRRRDHSRPKCSSLSADCAREAPWKNAQPPKDRDPAKENGTVKPFAASMLADQTHGNAVKPTSKFSYLGLSSHPNLYGSPLSYAEDSCHFPLFLVKTIVLK